MTVNPEESAPPPRRGPKIGRIVLGVVILVVLLAALGFGAAALFRSLAASSDAGSNDPPNSQTPTAPNDDDDEDGSDEEPTGPTQPPQPTPIVLPNCNALNPGAQAATQQLLDVGAELEPRPGEVGIAEFNELFGPATRDAMAQAGQMRGCYYVLSMHDALHQFAAEISADASAPLLAALRAEPLFTEGTIGSAVTFTSTHTEETVVGVFTESAAHAFLGDAWVSLYGAGDPAAALTAGLDAMIAANPALAEG